MAAVRDDFSGRRDRKTSTNLRQEYTKLINMDQGLMEARRWIERITFTPFKQSDFRESLVDGVLLCELVVNVASMSIGRINRSSTTYASTDNIKLFQRACETLGFDKSQLFDVTDLQEVPVKRGQSVLERAKESQRRLAKVGLTVYWLGKYANDTLNFTGSSSLNESCFEHLLQNQLPELPEIEGAEPIRHEPIETQQSEPSESIKDKYEIVTEAIDYGTNIQTFQQLEEESKRVQDEVERQRRRSFSASDKENQFIEEEKDRRRKSIGSKPVWKEGDSRYKHKKEILGGWKDPIKNRRDRIVQGGESPPKEKKIVGLNMRTPGDMRDKLSRFEQMNRQTSEESEVIQGKRSRPKSWGGGDSLTRGGSLVDKANKFESLQRQADKESAVLHGELRMPAVDNDDKRQNRAPVLSAATVNMKDKHSKYEKLDKTAHQQTMVLEGKHREIETDFEYDIGDKLNGPIHLPGTADVKLREKKRQFESLDYKAQRESSILKLHSGKSFDDATQRPKRSEPRPMSNVFDYQRSTHSYEPERSGDVVMRDVEGEGIQARDMNFVESSPDQNQVFMQNDYEAARKPVSQYPPAPPREDSLRYNSLTKRPEDSIRKLSKNKTTLYSSFAQQPEEPNKEGAKRPALKYKEFISYPVFKQRDRVERYNAAVQQLSKEPGKKEISSDQSTGRPRKKSLGSDEWIKVRPVEEPAEDLTKRPIQKLWDREPEDEDTDHKKRSQPVDTSFTAVENSNYVPDVKNMRYKDFAAPPKSVVKDHVIMSNAPVVESSGPRKISGIGPYSNFAQQAAVQDPNKPAPKVSMSYRDFVVPPPKEGSTSESEKAKAKKVKDLTKRFMELEAEQFKPKEGGPPQPKSLVDRDELVRYERESRARSWYGGPLGLDDEEFEGAYRRRVRRWSDYEYEEGDKTKSSPWEQQEPEQYDEMQSRKYPGTSAASSNQYQSYNGSVDPEIEVRKKPQMESSREWHQTQPTRSVEPLHDEIEVRNIPQVESSRKWHQPQPTRSVEPLHDEIEVRNIPQVESSREWHQPQPTRSVEPLHDEIEVRNIPQVESSREWHQPQSSTEYPPRSVEPLYDADPIPYGQTHEQDMRPTTSLLQHSEPEASQREDQSSSREDRRYGPTTSTHARTIGTRSWNEFESSRRKKSMELLDSRPSAKPYDSKEQQKVKGETDIYKLKRPADYLPKYKADQADKPSSQPSYHEPPKPENTYHHYFQSKTQDDFVPQEKYPQSQPEKYDEEPMPTSYPTYYPPDTGDQYRKGVATEVVQAEKPLIVSAKLHDKTKDSKPVQKPIPGDQAYEIVATTETSNNVESTQDFKAQQKLWEDLSSHKHTQPAEEPTEAFKVKELQAEKHVAMQPDMQKPRNAQTREREVEPVVTKLKRPQVFAIVGQGRQVRPLVAEIPEPVVVSQKNPNEEVPQLDTKEEPRAIPDQTRQQHRANVLISPSLSGAKVFNFDEDQKQRDAARSHPHTEKQLIPAMKNETVVVETVTVVEKSRGLDEDIFKALELSEDERLKRNIQNPEYREKLRKEVEEKNRKQREEAKYLTNLQMRQSLGTKDIVHDGEGRLRQEHSEGLESAGGNLEYLYDYNANRTENYARKDDPRYYANQRNRPNQGQYEIERREQERIESERLRQEHLHRERLKQQQMEEELEEKERREWERREQTRLEYERREQERLEHERREQERKEHERKEQERREWDRRKQERLELERREQERLEHQRQEQRRKELEQRERERKEEQERREWERKEQERMELARREQERMELERQEQKRKESEQRERERKERERREWERKEQERLELARREQERMELERREQERMELERQEQERLEHERREQERKERERKEQERREWERKEQERMELERQEQERLEHERREQERKERERKEQERREWERKEQERLELDRREQERLEHERREQERLGHERVEQQLREQERKEQGRMEEERRRREQLERERYEQNRRTQDEQRQRGRYGPREHERHDHLDERHDPRETHMQHDYRDVERHDPRATHMRHHREEERHDPRDTHRRHRDEVRHDPRDTHRREDHRDEERYDPRKRESHDYRDRERYERERIQRERREQERLDQERRELERRERHRREQEHLGPEERERHRLEQQRRVHEMVEQQQREEEDYKKSLSREDVHIHATSQQGPQTDSNTNWTKIEDGSRYSIYETFIAADQKRIVCTSCGLPINKDTALFVQELNRYWHKNCFRCVVCQVIFGSKEQRSPLMVSDSLLHCENCFITNEGEKYTEV